VVRIQALLFDYGGTLDGAASHWLDRFVDMYRDAGIEIPFERIKHAFYQADDAAYAEPRIAAASLRELMDFHVGTQLSALGISDAGLHQRLVDRFVSRSMAALAASRQVLDRLSRRFRLGVVSNFYGNVDRILTDADIAPLIGVIVDSTRVGLRKPDPRIYSYAVARLETPAAETLHVGDSYERDVVAASQAGLRTAWLVGDRNASAMPAGDLSDLHLRSLDELLVCFAPTQTLARCRKATGDGSR
jgi:putative hydrolase of the HAD superfamily